MKSLCTMNIYANKIVFDKTPASWSGHSYFYIINENIFRNSSKNLNDSSLVSPEQKILGIQPQNKKQESKELTVGERN
jgi:hypothetical protein